MNRSTRIRQAESSRPGKSKAGSPNKYSRVLRCRRSGRLRKILGLMCLYLAVSIACVAQGPARDPLPSWRDTAVKHQIVDFVARTTEVGSPDYVPSADRIVAFDNDGTLWTEQPVYAQMAFALDRVKTLAPQHPEWRNEQPFKAILDGNIAGLEASGEQGIVKVLMATHAGMTTDEFAGIVNQWISTAQHPRFHRLYTQCVYQPMLEVLRYFRTNGFRTYIVTGGGIEFLRPWTERVYGVPPEQVIGSSIKTKFELRDGRPVLLRVPEADFVDDRGGKPVGINKFIGRRPIAAFGNSDGDQQMFEWTAAGSGLRLVVLIHHTDPVREYAYDRDSKVGRLNTALDEATSKGWVVVDMKRDWSTIFPPLRSSARADLPIENPVGVLGVMARWPAVSSQERTSR